MSGQPPAPFYRFASVVQSSIVLPGDARCCSQHVPAMAAVQTQRTILIVDDDPSLRESLADLLIGEGYAAVCAGDGRRALAVLQSQEPPCVILLDLLMPVMDGWEFRDRQRQLAGLAEIPIVITTALSAEYRRENCLGAVAYLSKPLDVPHLLELVAEFCG